MMEVLKDDNYVLYASRNYQNAQCTTTAEFLDDLARFKYVKKLVSRYLETGELKERLILNHLIVLNNVFGFEHVARILWLKMDKSFAVLKPFLIYLNVMPDTIENVKKLGTIDTVGIDMDPVVIERLRAIQAI